MQENAAVVPVLDLGNVVVQVDFKPFCEWILEHSPARDIEHVQNFLRSSLFYDYEFGNISTEEFIERMGKLFGTQFDEIAFSRKFCEIFPGYVEGMPELLNEFTERGIYCLSNTNELHLSHCIEQFPEIKLFKQIFASHQIHKRKPYPGTYREVAKLLDISPYSIIYFDDILANVDGARRAGLQAHVFESASQVRSLAIPQNLS